MNFPHAHTPAPCPVKYTRRPRDLSTPPDDRPLTKKRKRTAFSLPPEVQSYPQSTIREHSYSHIEPTIRVVTTTENTLSRELHYTQRDLRDAHAAMVNAQETMRQAKRAHHAIVRQIEVETEVWRGRYEEEVKKRTEVECRAEELWSECKGWRERWGEAFESGSDTEEEGEEEEGGDEGGLETVVVEHFEYRLIEESDEDGDMEEGGYGEEVVIEL